MTPFLKRIQADILQSFLNGEAPNRFRITLNDDSSVSITGIFSGREVQLAAEEPDSKDPRVCSGDPPVLSIRVKAI